MRSSVVLALAAVLLLGVVPANAGQVLTSSFETQLAAWLGQGPLSFTNIYTKGIGDTSANFHAAVDGKGATFTLFEVTTAAGAYVVGGYDPLSWDHSSFWHQPADRTAFVYNLTTTLLLRQGLHDAGVFQTVNYLNYGPTFGGGYDLYVDATLNAGWAAWWSYGSYGNSPGVFGGYTSYSVGALEVYTFSPFAAVPDSGITLVLFGMGLAGLTALKRRRG